MSFYSHSETSLAMSGLAFSVAPEAVIQSTDDHRESRAVRSRHRAAAAADRMSVSRRRHFRGVHVMLYTS